jgi:D-alanyl-lipoteichoic acid acyltransferase DltB (MBOAT superfamily)
MSYTIEVYRRAQKAERNFGIYALYVMFYPQLVAGPIERPQNLLHQFHSVHSFDSARVVNGLRLMLWGFFKKVVIADTLAIYVNQVYDHPSDFPGITLMIATVFFAFQIFCDFSGYSDIAIGAARVMGFELMKNFDRPYAAKSINEFWRRWHISLSTWFKDYIYIPLGGNKEGNWKWYRNLFIIFLISGFWHGENWTFIIWGALHGFYLVFGLLTKDIRNKLAEKVGLTSFPNFHSLINQTITFILVCIAWIFFRATTVQDAFLIIKKSVFWIYTCLLNVLNGKIIQFVSSQNMIWGIKRFALTILLIGFMEAIHKLEKEKEVTHILEQRPRWMRWTIYSSFLYLIVYTGRFGLAELDFIYFQF